MIRKLAANEVRTIRRALEASGLTGALDLSEELDNARVTINVRRTIHGRVVDSEGDEISLRALRTQMTAQMQWEVAGHNASDRWSNARKKLAAMDDVEVVEYALRLPHGYVLDAKAAREGK